MDNWISVKDKFPNNYQRVIVWCNSQMDTPHVSLCTHYIDWKTGEHKWSKKVKNVMYWMPIPNPPKIFCKSCEKEIKYNIFDQKIRVNKKWENYCILECNNCGCENIIYGDE